MAGLWITASQNTYLVSNAVGQCYSSCSSADWEEREECEDVEALLIANDRMAIRINELEGNLRDFTEAAHGE
jgi:hypothetical protein